MKSWLRRIRGAVLMGVTWAAGWGVSGVLIGVASVLLPFLPWARFFRVFDAPLPALAMPGFVGGVIFSAVLATVGRRRRFDQLSLPLFAVLGAVGGVLLALVPAGFVLLGLGDLAEGVELWRLTLVFAVPAAALGSASATGSLLLARRAERSQLLAAGAALDGVGLTEAESRELLGPPPGR